MPESPGTPMQQVVGMGDLEPNPFVLSYSGENSIHSSSPDDVYNPISPVTRSSHTRQVSKGGLSMRASAHMPRLVLHNDAESESDLSQAAEVVELPPQYKSTRKSLVMAQPPLNLPPPD